ncbi:sugar ABC transporter permease [Lachnoclostridium sp. An169]|nr:sugar ABC transporter permease [Lachnoclostridium sp. An169]
MMLPGLIYLVINNYIPMYGITLAFRSIDMKKGVFGGDWVGFENFEFLFKTKDAFIITRNTILYNLVFIVLNMVFGVFVAILMSELSNKLLTKVYQTALMLPHLISMVLVTYLVYAFLSTENGLLNKTILPALGLEPVNWYMTPEAWPFILPIVNLWKSIGFSAIVYLSSVVGIDRAYYEAAELDGAGKWKQIRYITLPLLKPIIIMMVLMQVGRIFYSDFGLFYQVPMNSGILANTTNVIDTYVYRGLLQLGDIGMSSAAGAYQSLVGFVLILGANMLVRKISPDDALF